MDDTTRPPRPAILAPPPQDMWRLEDKVEGSERLTASGGSGQPRECSVATDQASGRREGEGRGVCRKAGPALAIACN